MLRVRRTAWTLFSVLPACTFSPGEPGVRVRERAALDRSGEQRADNAVIVSWGESAYEIAFAEDSFRTFKGHRAFAMMHLAMHDAVSSVQPHYRPYAYVARDSLADPVAAAAQAAHDVLRAQYPGAAAALDAELARWLPRATLDSSVARGIAVGRGAAAAILKLRRDDGWDAQGNYAFDDRPGSYRTTPPWDGFVAQPGFRFSTPFALTSGSQLRPPPPPSLESPAYAQALDEVKRLGRVDSPSRTPDRTAYAIWWMEYAEGSVLRLARRLVTERGLPLAETARIFALMTVGVFDMYVAVWDSKYEFNHWRPVTAIHQAGRDGNPATAADPGWQPLRPTPPFPDYVSAHAAACATTFGLLKRVLGDASFAMTTITAPVGMRERRFASFDDAAGECADSRVMLGWHFRYATDAGLALGRGVAAYVAERRLQPSVDGGPP